MTIIHWFRRDLRLRDNTALSNATLQSDGDVVPVFILDDALLKGKDIAPARVRFMLDSLRDLDKQLKKRGSQLVVLKGDAEQALTKFVRETNASAVFFNKDYTPAARKRDARVTKSLQSNGVKVEAFKDLVVFEEDELRTGEGKPYTVFTPYKKAWLQRPIPQPIEAEAIFKTQSGFAPSHIPSPKELGFDVAQSIQPGGENEATRLLQNFVASGALQKYSNERDFLSVDGTSHLSAHLRFGTISPRLCYAAAVKTLSYDFPRKQSFSPASTDAKKEGADAWISELIWREFYHQILWNFPHADKNNFRREYDALVWGNGSATRDDELFAAWCEGRVGYPIVDAAMRQLNETGWMHNRARMIVASFLTKDLLIDWRRGESYFMQMLVDGDPAANNGGWQWAASTGTDAQPYFRIFNPRLQSERFDPNGDYIRKWVKELARVPNEYIHAPNEMTPIEQGQFGCVIGEDYPAPIVDHASQKEEALRRFKAIKQ